MRKKLMLVSVLSLSFLLQSCCTFYFLDGEGPVPRERTALATPLDTPEEVFAAKKVCLLEKPRRQAVGEHHATVYTDMSIGTIILKFVFGGWGAFRTYTDTDDPNRRDVVTVSRYASLPLIIWVGSREHLYDADTGTPLYAAASHYPGQEFGMLAACATSFTGPKWKFWPPSKIKNGERFISDCIDKSRSLDDIMYHEGRAFCLAAGALAMGSNNGRAYLQIAWIPIPLWKTRP